MARSRSRKRSALHTSAHDDFFGLPTDWDSSPTVRRLRRGLTLVDLQEVRHVAEDVCHTDALSATRCNSPFLALRWQKNRHCSPSRACYRPPGSWSSLLEYFFRASVNTSGRLGTFNLILMSWTFAGTTARAILLSLATTSTSYTTLYHASAFVVSWTRYRNSAPSTTFFWFHSAQHYAPLVSQGPSRRTFALDCSSVYIKKSSFQLFSFLFFLFFFAVSVSTFLIFACRLALTMTKRDSVTASLPSPRDLRMASEHELGVPMTLTSGVAQAKK